MAAPVPTVPEPSPIPDTIKGNLNLQEEKDERLVQLAAEENAILVCAVAPFRAVRVSPVEEISAYIGIHEEFAFEALIDEIAELGMTNKKIMILLHSPGGDLHSSFKVARAIRETFASVEIYVPHMAASGGTLIALAGDKIVMGLMSQLSPLDPQVPYQGRMISALCFRRAYDRLCKQFEKITKDEAPYPQQVLAEKLDPYRMEDWNSAILTAEQYVEQILTLSRYEDAAPKIARELIHRFTDHDSDINFEAATKIGIRVEKADKNKKAWRVFRYWLGQFVFQEAGSHVIRYVLPPRPAAAAPAAANGGSAS